MPNLLLLSNSTNAGREYLAHAWDSVLEALDGVDEITFVPYALADHDAYTSKVRQAFASRSISVVGVHESGDPVTAVRQAKAIFVGGGNSFRLLDTVKRNHLVVELHNHVAAGRLYMGASAGTNIATPTIRTTNDMPIVFPEGFDALGLVPFQINCHYLDADPDSTHAGETRELRIEEFHEENSTPVVGLREGAWIRVFDGSSLIGGESVNPVFGPARLFEAARTPREIAGSFSATSNSFTSL